MNIFEYEKPNISEYELDIWQKGICPSLGKIHILGSQVIFDYASCRSIDDIKNQESLKDKIALLRRIVEAKIRANDYLISDGSLSLEVGKMWLKGSHILFLPGDETEGFFERFCSFCREMDEKLAERLQKENAASAFSSQSLLRILSTWELEI